MIKLLQVTAELAGQRLDEGLARLAGMSKGEARRIIDRGGCAINQSMVRVASRLLKGGETLTVGIMQPGEFHELALPSAAIIYQDRDILAVCKPSGVASQRTPYQLKGTLEHWVSEEFVRQGIKEPVRVVHRLDRGTSGVMLFPKHRQSAAWLSALFKEGAIRKRYLALVTGVPSRQVWSADGAIGKIGNARWGVVPGGRSALTEFAVQKMASGRALLEALPKTGRTHQIRVHLADAGLPIVGDAGYGGSVACRLMLHCLGLAFTARDGSERSLEAQPDAAFIDECGDCW